VDYIHLARDMDQWWTTVNMVMTFLASLSKLSKHRVFKKDHVTGRWYV
jgi:hypothetical protein